jgi:catechol 2,3-dioxygenase-like lactoylglutathione lyase family enzyme
MKGLGRTIPALPVGDIGRAVECFTAKFGFEAVHVEEGFAVLAREDSRIHLWAATDRSWGERADLAARPVSSGAESFLAGTASCRIEVVEVDSLYEELAATGVLHPGSREGVTDTDFGTREFACLDLDGNLIEFFRWTAP